MIVRTCLMCGKDLPELCSQSRKYCDACAAERNRELTRKRQQRETRKQIDSDAERQHKANVKYCHDCIYCGSEMYGRELCNYILMTGHRRGCKYGVGCEKRSNECVMKAGIYKAVSGCTNIDQKVKELAREKCIALGFKPTIEV